MQRFTPFFQVRAFSCSKISCMPYSPHERPPLTDREKKIYPQVEQEFTEEGYPILKVHSRTNIFKPLADRRRAPQKYHIKSRESSMKEDQDWPSIWPTAKTFSPSAVPLPLRQSYEKKVTRIPRGKYANTELLKIANFLHLTPEAIKRQCTALRKFCTKWPEELNDDNKTREYLPVTFITKDYIHASPSLRDPRARVVQLKINVKDLKLNAEDEYKLIQLAMHRYNEETQELTIQADACPTKIQNKDYAEYLLTALYSESRVHQDWEKLKPTKPDHFEDDLDAYLASVEQKLGLTQSTISNV